jgi:hypothetical protein
MQIDGHHTMTYVAARLAGFGKRQAEIIAYSAQYVDDATNAGEIHFKNGAMFSRIASAHKMLDYRNSDELANHRVWIPFHFLPGNGGLKAGEGTHDRFIRKIVCHPNSHVAQDMLRACAMDLNKPYALHRIGITMHVYADTFAHQGFAGVNHEINEVKGLKSSDQKMDQGFFEKMASYFLSESFPLGHGAALSYPDQPFLTWEYTNGLGDPVKRDNPHIFMDAVELMCKAMKCFRKADLAMDLNSVTGISDTDQSEIHKLITGIKDDSGEKRHEKWLEAIEEGVFSFGSERIEYKPKGDGSWKHAALGQLRAVDTGREEFRFKKSFMKSNWKLFHDALQGHRFDILHDVLPKYGICAA